MKNLQTLLVSRGPRGLMLALEEAISRKWTGFQEEWLSDAGKAAKGPGPQFPRQPQVPGRITAPVVRCSGLPAGQRCESGLHVRDLTEAEFQAKVDKAQWCWGRFGGRAGLEESWRQSWPTTTLGMCPKAD